MVIAPILEICEVLASRGHIIEFATLEGRHGLVNPYPFVSSVHVVGRAITPAEDEQLYLRYSRWDNTTQHGRRDLIKGKKFFDSFWPETYRGLKRILVTNPPDFIFADYQVEAAKDICRRQHIPRRTCPTPCFPRSQGHRARSRYDPLRRFHGRKGRRHEPPPRRWLRRHA